MLAVDRDEFKKVPYVDHVPMDGRALFLQPYFDREDNTFKLHVPQGRKLTWVFAKPVKACYYSEQIIDDSTDIYVKLVDVIARHYSFDTVMSTLLRIVQDIQNCSVVVEKYFVFLNLYIRTRDLSTSDLVTTDIEYFFGNLRSMYDLLQGLIQDLWKRFSRRKLPPSFNDMVKQEPQDLKRKYNLPDPLINYYTGARDFFIKCRKIRDSIHHRGLDIQIVFCTEDGFALQKDSPLFPSPLTLEFDIWPDEKIKKNGLVSVLALISYINREVLTGMDALSEALVQSIQTPTSVSETHRLFLRGPFIDHLLKSDYYLGEQWAETPQRNDN